MSNIILEKVGIMKKPNKKSPYCEIRVYIPLDLGALFIEEAKNECRKQGEQLTKIFQERYLQGASK